MPDREFRVGLVGCGRISKNHFDAIRRVDGLTLAAVADIDSERARTAGEQMGVPSFKNLDEMLAVSETIVNSCSACHDKYRDVDLEGGTRCEVKGE